MLLAKISQLVNIMCYCWRLKGFTSDSFRWLLANSFQKFCYFCFKVGKLCIWFWLWSRVQNIADPAEQLRLAVIAVFDSWNSSRADKYRSINQITGLKGTAVNIQAMVFGNMGADSGTGVLFTRNPSTGEKKLYGEYLINAQVILNSTITIHWSPIELMSPESKLSMKMVESFDQSVSYRKFFLLRCILSLQ